MGNTCGEPLSFSEVGPEVASTVAVFALTCFIAGDPFMRRHYRSTLLIVLLLETIRRGGGLFKQWYEREGHCKYDLGTLEGLNTTLDVLYILENAFVMFCVLRLVNAARYWSRGVRTWVQYVPPTAFAVIPLVAVAQDIFSDHDEPILEALRVHSIFIMQLLSLIGVVMLWRRLILFRHLLLIFAVLLLTELPASAEPIYETYFEPTQAAENFKKYYDEYANIVFAIATTGILIRQRIFESRTRTCVDDTLLL